MKLLFRGWKREKTQHDREVIPVTTRNGAYTPGKTSGPLTWNTPFQALGKVNRLALSGNFLVEFNFDQEELRNWLRQFVLSKPEEAVRLLAEMQADAVIALARKAD